MASTHDCRPVSRSRVSGGKSSRSDRRRRNRKPLSVVRRPLLLEQLENRLLLALTTIDFDHDAAGNSFNAPCLFADTTNLTNLYSSLGVTFSGGSSSTDGGAILNQCGNFGVNARSGSNFLAFNTGAQTENGGIPKGPESLSFSTPVTSAVEIFAYGSGKTFTMQAYRNNIPVASDSGTSSAGVYVRLSVGNTGGIDRVVLNATSGGYWVFDDLSFTTGSGNGTSDADAGGPYEIDEGQSLTLDASGSTASAGAAYQWDVDGDGDFDESVTGVNPTIPWSQLVGLGIDDGPDRRTVTVQVSEGGVSRS